MSKFQSIGGNTKDKPKPKPTKETPKPSQK